MHDPFLLRDMDRAIERLLQAITQKQKILLYGDYDVDGTTSIVVLKKALDLAAPSRTSLFRIACATATECGRK